jgi:hypothetical protein
MLSLHTVLLTLLFKTLVLFVICWMAFENMSPRKRPYGLLFYALLFLACLGFLFISVKISFVFYPYFYYAMVIVLFAYAFPKFFYLDKNTCLGFLVWEYIMQFYLEIIWICCLVPFCFPSWLNFENIVLWITSISIFSSLMTLYFWQKNTSQIIQPYHVLILPTINLMFLEIMMMTFPHNQEINVHFTIALIGLVILTFITIFYVLQIHRLDMRQESQERLKISNETISTQYEYLSKEYGKLRSVEHDISNQLLTIEILQKQGHYEQAKTLSRQLLEKIEALNEEEEEI